MTGIASDTVRLDEEHAYSIVIGHRAVERPEWTGLSRAGAMKRAETLRGGGYAIRVMHVIGDKSYEVDSYPVR
jgi:hypothetical protein